MKLLFMLYAILTILIGQLFQKKKNFKAATQKFGLTCNVQ